MDISPEFRITKMSPLFIVKDIERSVAFFTGQLGFHVEFRYEGFYVGVRNDVASIHLKKSYFPSAGQKTDSDDLDIVFSVTGIEALYQRLSANSVQITQPLRQMPYGKEFYISDPDGHILAFVESA
ncbi:MAG TPA: VOC family protein [Puia sp.]|nr:VOC family protein [Puia sp.]